jgi:hypothetical protein
MAIADLENLQYRLGKRGFRLSDPLYHECPKCKERAVQRYAIVGRNGGRDIALCIHCGEAQSWRSDPAFNDRVEDVGFDLRAFLA